VEAVEAAVVLLARVKQITDTQAVLAAPASLFWDLLWAAVVAAGMETKDPTVLVPAVSVDRVVEATETVIMHSPTQVAAVVAGYTGAKRRAVVVPMV
jgi:hypothetical protein